jgi:hypothetical protein
MPFKSLRLEDCFSTFYYFLVASPDLDGMGLIGTHNTSGLMQNRGGEEDMLPGPSLEAPSKLNDSNKDINWYRGRAGPYGHIPEQ